MIIIMIIIIMMRSAHQDTVLRGASAWGRVLNKDFSILSHPSAFLLTYSFPLKNRMFGGP